MILETKRLILRPWREEDAAALYLYARDPRVGPIAGWPVHTSVENSREIIKEVLMAAETYAVVPKDLGEPVGSAGLMVGENSTLARSAEEGEIGYWLGVPFWGRGLIPEASEELLRHGFEDLGLDRVWAGYFDGNEKSHRVMEKLGMEYHHTEEEKYFAAIGEAKTQHVLSITKARWQARRG